MKVRKAVIPVAGLGTRFLPATKSVPKELLPIVDVPAIQLVVEEALASGIEEIVLITGRGKEAIIDHFDHSYELEDTLERRGQKALVAQLEKISSMVTVLAIRQRRPLGLGHAILAAKPAVGEEPFAILLPDDLYRAKPPATRQLIDRFEESGKGVIALLDVPKELTSRYGIIDGELVAKDLYRVVDLVEKPAMEVAPSTLAISGRYVLPSTVFELLEKTEPGHGGEIQLTDALVGLARSEGLLGCIVEGVRHDIGDKLGFLQANIAYALEREDIASQLRAYMRSL